MNNKGLICLICSILIFLTYCSDKNDKNIQDNPAVVVNENSPDSVSIDDNFSGGISYNNLLGRWELKYSGNYGYYFHFQNNFKAIVILYLGNEKLAFKGVYSAEPDMIKVNIYEMKREKKSKPLNMTTGFLKANSSSFIFKAGINKRKGVPYLVLAPLHIRIDGNASDGYFEPLIKLKYSGS